MPHLDRTATVAQIVAEHAVAARVFQRHHIDFCCHGNVTVDEACAGRSLEPAAVFAELEASLAAPDRADGDLRSLSTPALVAHVIERHHGYLRRALPYLRPLVDKVSRVHGPKETRLAELRVTFHELADALEPHLDEEEESLFPSLMSRQADRAAIGRELERMYADHVEVGAQLARLRALSDGYATPEWGCASYRALMSELEALETDVLRHVHLENHVLMPRFAGGAEGSRC